MKSLTKKKYFKENKLLHRNALLWLKNDVKTRGKGILKNGLLAKG
jgi:hypothetical protein